ncbi:MAG: hypothetical protein JO279_06050, partial [Verrucomicrobia bacterium]|nr:hypothetical protein [Verrucomicrobiota bacterium]
MIFSFRKSAATILFSIWLASLYPWLSAKEAGNLIVYDFIPDLDRFLRIAPEEKESRAKLFLELMIRPHPEIYNRPQIFRTDIPSLEQYLDGLNAYLPA